MKLKIVCLNMWSGGKLFDEIKRFAQAEKADIMALQEVWHTETYPPEQEWHMVSVLAHILGYNHYAFAPALGRVLDGGRRVQMGNAIFSQFPIRSSSTIFYDVPYNGMYPETPGDYRLVPRNLQHGEMVIGEKTFHVFNTQGIWGFDGVDNERRLQMGEIIAREIAGKTPVILTGDFNVQENTQTTAKIEAHLKNVFQGELTTSFNLRHKEDPGFATAVVDMMFVSPDVTVKNHYASSANVSDHLALVGEFEI